jgi:hypothetical protein
MSETNWDGIMKALVCGGVIVTSNGKVIDCNALKEDTDMIEQDEDLSALIGVPVGRLRGTNILVTDQPDPANNIPGYRELSSIEREKINHLKAIEQSIMNVLKDIYVHPDIHMNQRWLAIARTHIEQGFMAAIRAIARPETVEF